jgi:sn-glycerol 3-phosphate transport system permease protein
MAAVQARDDGAGQYQPKGKGLALETAAAWALALLWIAPLLYAVWAAFHPPEFSSRFEPLAPLTLRNFARAWDAAPFARYFLNTFALVTLVLASQLVLCTLAAFAFARYEFPGSGIVFALVLAQLMIMPDVLLVENYRTMSHLGLVDSIPAIALPYVASAFGIFLLRQTFKQVPRELDDAARVEGASGLQTLLKVYVPLGKPVYLAYGLVSVSYHWNNFLWPLIITSSVESRPLTVGLQVFSSSDQGIDWSVICAATLMTSGPLLLGFLLFQRQFVQSFMRAGVK